MLSLKNTEADPPPIRNKRQVIDGSFLVLSAFTALAGIAVFLSPGGGCVPEIVADTFAFLAVLAVCCPRSWQASLLRRRCLSYCKGNASVG
jgi:hypothetical protein